MNGDREMVKNLTKHGNSFALVIDKAIMELLHINPDTPLSLETDGKSLTIRPLAEDERTQDVMASLDKVNRRYGKVLKRLA
jgi:antitoxin MazE